jgi:SSS family solute:Na+ symporter
MPPWQTILVCGILNVAFASHSGLWGVLVIDMIQFFIKMTAVVAAAWFSLKQVGGLHALIAKLSQLQVVTPDGAQPVLSPIDGHGQPILDILTNFSLGHLALMIFIMPIAIGWWANWYPGAEPGGGSYIAQRMLASKSEKDSLGSTLFFNLAHYVLRPWPWIITALCSIIVFPDLDSIRAAFPHADPRLLGHDSAFPAMLKFLPAGFVGLMVGGLIAANSSTILTHLNWGSSYLVHDFYRRFIKPDATERHYVLVGRLCTILLYLFAAVLSSVMSSAQQAFQILLSIGAGTGLLYVVRWFWWRVSAWCEVAAMGASLISAAGFPYLTSIGVIPHLDFASTTILQVGFTTICWITTAFFAPPADQAKLIEFYRKVHPAGPGWAAVRLAAGVTDQEIAAHADHMGLATGGWIAGCTLIWSSLFAIGNFLYGRTGPAWMLTAVAILSSVALIFVVNRLWDAAPSQKSSPA